MGRGVTVNFRGAEGLESKFRAMAEHARTKTLAEAVPPAAEMVTERMRELVPVDEGMLQKSLEMRVLEQGAARFIMTMKTPAPHWHLIEFGHRAVSHSGKEVGHVAARPYIRPAFDATKNAMKNEIRDGIRDSILGFTE